MKKKGGFSFNQDYQIQTVMLPRQMVQELIRLVLKQIVCMLTLLLGISKTLYQLNHHNTKVLLKIADKNSKKH